MRRDTQEPYVRFSRSPFELDSRREADVREEGRLWHGVSASCTFRLISGRLVTVHAWARYMDNTLGMCF